MKKFISLVLTLSIIFSLSTMNTFAAEAETINWEELSLQSGIPAEDLQDAYNIMPEEDFYKALQDCIDAMIEYKSLPPVTSLYSAMSNSAWLNFKNSLLDGSILITSDSITATYAHGHAGIISGIEFPNISTKNYYITEHPGNGTNDGLSWRFILTDNTTNYWRTRTDLGVFNASSTSIMTSASAVARTSLILNKGYTPLASKTNTTQYNCATLVYRCYLNSGLDISKASSSTVLPRDITQSSNLYNAYQYGAFDWGWQ